MSEDKVFLNIGRNLMEQSRAEDVRKMQTELTALRQLVKEMGESIDRFMAYGNIYRVRDWETNPYEKAKEILFRPLVREIMEGE